MLDHGNHWNCHLFFLFLYLISTHLLGFQVINASYSTSRFAFFYCQISNHISNFLNQRCFLKSKRMRWRGMKLGMFMERCWWVTVYLIEKLYPIKTSFTRLHIFQCAAGQSIYDRLKMFPALMSHPACAVLRTNEKVVTKGPGDFYDFSFLKLYHLNATVCDVSMPMYLWCGN